MDKISSKDWQTVEYPYYFTLIAITILYYDYFLTINWEIDRVWKSTTTTTTNGPGWRLRLGWGTGLFYFSRYVCLLGHIPVVVEYFWFTSNPRKQEICRMLHTYHQYLSVSIQVVVACMLVMRVYALYAKRRFVLVLYLLILSVAGVVCAWSLAHGKNKESRRDVNLPFGCAPNMSHEFAIRAAVAWGSMLVFDLVVFLMTVYKSVNVPRLGDTSLVDVLFRDGAVYFGVITTLNLSNMLTYLLGTLFTRGLLTTMTNIISCVMISRLVLNLRHPSLVSNALRTSQPGTEDEHAYPDLTFVRPGQSAELSQVVDSSIRDTSRRKYDFR